MGCENCLNSNEENEMEIQNKRNDNSLNEEKANIIKNNKTFSGSLRKSQQNFKKIIDINSELFNSEVLETINQYRFKHGLEELTMEEEINKISQKYSEKLARESELELSGNKYNGKELGEIIFCYKEGISPKELIDMWYINEAKNYDYKKEPKVPSNFTQLIWKNSKSIGIGHTLTKDNKLYIVINFFPGGNIKGEFLKNIFPPLSHRKYSTSEQAQNSKFLEEVLLAHNELRIRHNSPPLILNPILIKLAQNHSEALSKEEKLINSNNKLKNQKIGENLFMSKNSCSGEEVTSYWYRGIKKYNFNNLQNNNENDIEINNFTQMIWKSTKEVGFGYSFDKKGNFYVVANYYPCGNIKGEYINNVLSY